MGHTTRCIPLIGYLLSLGHLVTVAGNASQRAFIEETFGGIDFIHLDGYQISYSRWNRWAQSGLLAQMPKILNAIKREHAWLETLAHERQIDGIISDNRYGLYHAAIPSVILTHQLCVQTGMGQVADTFLQRLHYRFLNRFTATWIPDAAGADNLGGKLSHTGVMPAQFEYLGLLSRFALTGHNEHPATPDASGPLVILLSGPEPQRTELSAVLWRQACAFNRRIIFVEGSEQARLPGNIPPHIEYHKRLGQQDLYLVLSGAGMVVCRSGYSTLMDLVALHKQAILIPTPGQTEQQYLAKRLKQAGQYYASRQDTFELGRAVREAEQAGNTPPGLRKSFSSYQSILKAWADSL